MEKRSNRYRLQLEYLENAKGDITPEEPLTLDFNNHDNIFGIIARLQEKNPFDDENQAAEFAIGLKMFSEVMLKNKDNSLFDELMPAFLIFMKKLKSL